MSSLTDEHIEFITRKINSSNILSAEMKEDFNKYEDLQKYIEDKK
jgi:hypothetical protein